MLRSIAIIILCSIILLSCCKASPLDDFYLDHAPHTVFVGYTDGSTMIITEARGIARDDVLGVERPVEPTNTLLNVLMLPKSTCVVAEVRHMSDPVYRLVTNKYSVKFLHLCPIRDKNELVVGFAGIYVLNGNEKNLEKELKELVEKL